jgi:hypothetical protein
MFKLDIKTSVGGREVPLENFADEFAKAAEAEILGSITATIAGVKCSAHGKSPQNIHQRRNGTKVEWSYEACCERLRGAVEAALQE